MGLAVKNITKSFGDLVAVDNISFSMDKPGVFGLIGTNGAGKTTTIRTVLGIMSADGGTAEWEGRRITRETLCFGYMPEERGIYMKSKVLEQLVYFGALKGMSKAAARRSAVDYMEKLGVSEYKDTVAEKLSKGNQQKIQLIAALIHEPVLIVLDEPFAGLDPMNSIMLSDLIGELVSKDRFIIMSSHQMGTVEEYCEDILILNRGKTMLQGNLNQIKKGYGSTNLVISRDDGILPIAEENGLVLIEKNAGGFEFKIKDDKMAGEFLSRVIEKGIMPTKYIVKEPSLKEIFIEKVGSAE